VISGTRRCVPLIQGCFYWQLPRLIIAFGFAVLRHSDCETSRSIGFTQTLFAAI
jgi:hypothetical protein